MSTDRELLELAAKAAGLKYTKPAPEYSGALGLALEDYVGRWICDWNPLTDDGDALRLAVKLRIKAGYDDNLPPELGMPREGGYALCQNRWFAEVNEQDPCAAVRRAIVRAAASIAASQEKGE